jgi:TonB family protein
MTRRCQKYRNNLLVFSAKIFILLLIILFLSGSSAAVRANIHHIVDKGGKEIIFVNGYNVSSVYRNELTVIRTEQNDDDLIHLIADSYPSLAYPGGIKAFIDQHISYPDQAIANKTEGIVLVNFIVEKDGTISNAHIIRGIGYGCDEEVLKVLDELPDMVPGTIAHIPVRIAITLPVRFKLKF